MHINHSSGTILILYIIIYNNTHTGKIFAMEDYTLNTIFIQNLITTRIIVFFHILFLQQKGHFAP